MFLRKNKKKCLLSILFLTLSIASFAQTDIEKDYEFDVYNFDGCETPEVSIAEYKGNETELQIPSRYKGNHINRIQDEVFSDKGLTSVVLPEKIYDIGYKAFAGNNLTSIIIPARVIIYSYAFKDNNITSIAIGSNVFFYDEDEPVFELDFDNFFTANGRKAGTYKYINGNWSVEYNVIEDDFEFNILNDRAGDESYEIIISGYKGKASEIQIPGHFNSYRIGRIGESAFAGKGLTSVIIPENICAIDDEAFSDNELTNLIIPEGIIICDKAFAGNKLNSVTFKGSNSIYGSPFQGNNITKINVGLYVGIYDNEEKPAFELGFDGFFAGNKERDGSYVYQNGSWKVEYDIIENGFAANISKDGVSAVILDYFGSDTNISIPAKIGNYPVTAIGYWAFYKKGLTGIKIPVSVTSIHQGAFAENNLATVTIPNSVNTIEEKAFAYNKITELTIPDTVKSILNEAFADNMLTNITIPAGISSLVYRVFDGNQLTELVIPDNIKSINRMAFANNKLISVIIPQSVTYIGEEAFANNKLTSINIPDSVTEIEKNAFIGNQISNAVIPNNVTRMRSSIFDDTVTIVYAPDKENDFKTEFNESGGVTITAYAGKKTEIRIPPVINGKPVTEIGADSFWYKKIKSVAIPDTVTKINHRAFFCNEIKEIKIPDSVNYISDRAFYGNGLNKINIPDGITFIGMRTFTMNNLKNIIIPDSVTIIEAQAFNYNKLTEIVIPHSVAIIGYEAFARNPITKITIGALVSFGEYCFDNKFYFSYVDNDRKAGTYQYIDGQWNYSGTDEENEAALELAEKRNLHLIATAADPWNFIGFHYYSRGRYDEAVTAFSEAILIAPNSAYLRLMRGVSYDKLNEFDKAVEDYNEAIQLNPDYETARQRREILLNRKNQE